MSINKGGENNVGEDIEKNSDKNDHQLMDSFLNDFTSSYYSGEKERKRIKSAFKKDQIGGDLKRELEKFIALNPSKYGFLDLNKININHIRSKIIGKNLSYESKKNKLMSLFLDEYSLDEEQKNNLDLLLNNLNLNTLNSYILNKSSREKIVSKNFSNLIKNRNRLQKFFTSINSSIDYESLNDSQKDIILSFFNHDGTYKKIDSVTLGLLFSEDLLNFEEKKILLNIFVPSLKLSFIRNINLFGEKTDSFVNEVKQKISKKVLKKNELSFKIDNLDSYIDENDFFVDIGDIFSYSNFVVNDENIQNIVENSSFNELLEQYNSTLEEVENKEIFGNNGDIDKETFSKHLESLQNLSGVNNFKNNSYLVLDCYDSSLSDKEKIITKQFFKIKSIEDNYISIFDYGFGKCDIFTKSLPKQISYTSFFNLIKNGFTKGNIDFKINISRFVSKENIDSGIKSGDIETIGDEGVTFTERTNYFKKIELEEEISLLEDRLKKSLEGNDDIIEIRNNIKKLNISLNKEDLEVGDKENLEDEIASLYKKIDSYYNYIIGNPDDFDLTDSQKNDIQELKDNQSELIDLDIFTYEKLTLLIDEFDNKGKGFGFGEGISFSSKKGIFTVSKIDLSNQTIDISTVSGENKDISFEDFFKTFKEMECFRSSKKINSNEIIDNLLSDSTINLDKFSSWKNFKFENNGITRKDTTNKIQYDYLIGEDNELIKINSFSGNTVSITFGEYDKYEKSDNGEYKIGDDGKKVKKPSFTTFSGSTKKVEVSWLYSWIKKSQGNPSSMDEYKDVSNEDVKGADIKKSFWSRYVSRLSLFDLMSGVKIGFDSIEGFLKEGSEEKAALAAQGIFSKIMPDQLKYDLMSRVEESQKKRADDYVNKLNNVDSWKATEMIEKWLKNKNSPGYLKEAGATFMLQKYGVLYAKSGLHKYKGTYLFYESFGGKIGDELYENIKKQASDTNQNFTEEWLVYELLKKQCKLGGFNGISRRSRLHKEFKKFRAVGKQEEYETGKGDAKDERTVGARINGCKGELKGGTYPNARGWLEEVVNKGGSMEELNEIPFIMAFSGIAYKFEQNELDAFKNFPSNGMMLPALRFLSLNKDITLLNETILRICERLKDIKGDNKIYTEALDIFSNQQKSGIDDYSRIEKTEKFYAKYGKQITDILYGLNTGSKDKDSYLSKMIYLEKDKDSTFSRYHNTLNSYSNEFKWGDENLFADAFSGAGTSGINISKATRELLEQHQGGGYKKNLAGEFMWKEIRTEIESVIKRDYGIYGEEGKEKDLKNIIKGFVIGLLQAHGTSKTALTNFLSSNTSPLYSYSKKWGIDFMKIMKYSSIDMEESRGDKMIEGYVDILLGKKESEGSFSVLDTISGVKSANDGILDEKIAA